MGQRVVDQRKLQEYAARWSSMTKAQNCEVSRVHNIYQDLLSRISSDSQLPGGWVQGPNAPIAGMGTGVRESAVSGQTAALNEKGLAGVCASNKTTDMEMFVGRLAVSLGFHVQEYKSLQQLAAGWARRVHD